MRIPLLVFLFLLLTANAQDPLRFQGEVDAISKKYGTLWDSSKETIVFTGSSSIRMWDDLQKRFPGQQIVNSAFGGSQASDLLAYSNELILHFNPKKVFLYEGDNDLADKKRVKVILADLQKIIDAIQHGNRSTHIVLISAKPSPARWHLRHKYKRLNRGMEKLTQNNTAVEFANIWDVMLVGQKPMPHIFIADGLHMNTKGYDLWYAILKNYIN